MTEPLSKTSPRAEGGEVPAKSVFSELRRMAALYWASRERKRLLMLAAGIFIVIAATAHMQVRLNAWNQPFYDAVTRKDVPDFIRQLGVFAILAAILLVLNVSQVWLNQTTKLTLRRSLVHDMVDQWLKPLRAFRLSNAGSIGANPDQRMSADAQHLADLVTDLLIGLLQSTLLLLSFIGVLWFLSQQMFLPWGGRRIQVPGYLVWCALLYSAAASFLSWRVGRPLIALNAERYAREAELRFALVRVNEDIEGITICGGEAGEKQLLDRVFESVLEVTRRIVGAVTRLTWVTSGYGWFTIVAPILVASPSYLSGKMTFGQLMVAVGAFNQVQSCLRWFVDNFSILADWRATRRRVASFQRAVETMDGLGRSVGHISLEETQDHSIRIDDLSIAATDGSIKLSEPHVEVRPGERTLIVGERGTAGAFLLNAIIGIWPWGGGRITRPLRQAMMFLPARAYVPPGTLRAALAYPRAAVDYEDAAITRALADVGLEHLRPLLDTTDRWDRRLNENEKQSLAFARVCLQRPQWLVLNGAFDALNSVSRGRIEALFAGPLSDVGVVDIGQGSAADGFFTRKLRLVTDPEGPMFRPAEYSASSSA
ncbi:MAG TPA: ABC transporter ATP-binding protein/permease [Casimicrobiaceae bacterium]|nr:ABC transporter ATP-binding protein/permease [Casimicrobiaceae bacterium]